MGTTYDPDKRQITLEKRGLDFDDAHLVIDHEDNITDEDRDLRYGEQRLITYGPLHGEIVRIVWTERGDDYHIISMRKANGPERKHYRRELGGPG